MDPIPSEQQLLDACRVLRTALGGVAAIYAFGSVAHGTANADSDVDLAVLGERSYQPQEIFELGRILGVRLDRDVDLVDLRLASSVLKKEIVAGGRLLYARDADAVRDYEARILSEYGRYRENVAEILQAVESSGKAYAAERGAMRNE